MKRSIISIAVIVLALVASISIEAKVKKQSGSRRGQSIAAVEAQIIKAAKHQGNSDAYEAMFKATGKLENLIKTNPKTMDYNFKKLEEANIADIETSGDGKVRYYQWDHNGGTMSCFTVWCQYRTAAGKVVTENVVSGIDGECGGKHDFVGELKASNGATVYVESISGKADSFSGGISLMAYTIGKQGIVPVKFMKNGKDVTDDLDVEFYNVPGWYFKTDGEGWDWTMSLDEKNQDAYVSLVDEIPLYAEREDIEQLTDRYDVYHFNGKQFEYKRTGAGYWLHSSLGDYRYLVSLATVGKYMVRIDCMSDGTYRYASWKKDAEMLSKPDLVINGGTFDKDYECFTFKNGNYVYIVNMVEESIQSLEIKDNGKSIYFAEK